MYPSSRPADFPTVFLILLMVQFSPGGQGLTAVRTVLGLFAPNDSNPCSTFQILSGNEGKLSPKSAPNETFFEQRIKAEHLLRKGCTQSTTSKISMLI